MAGKLHALVTISGDLAWTQSFHSTAPSFHNAHFSDYLNHGRLPGTLHSCGKFKLPHETYSKHFLRYLHAVPAPRGIEFENCVGGFLY
jgi:hypothetical protein